MDYKLIVGALIAVVITVGSCQAGAPGAPTPFASEPERDAEVARYLGMVSVPFSTVVKGGDFYGGGTSGQQETTSFSSTLELEAFNRERNLPVANPLLPPLDFEQHTGILVTSGRMPDTSHETDIVAIHDAGDAYVVYAIIWTPNPGSTVAPMEQNPYHYVRTARLTKPVRFAPVLKAYLRERPNSGSAKP